ncbi:MAG: hypothetical protein ACJ786_05540 [Catenulispora sp.]
MPVVDVGFGGAGRGRGGGSDFELCGGDGGEHISSRRYGELVRGTGRAGVDLGFRDVGPAQGRRAQHDRRSVHARQDDQCSAVDLALGGALDLTSGGAEHLEAAGRRRLYPPRDHRRRNRPLRCRRAAPGRRHGSVPRRHFQLQHDTVGHLLAPWRRRGLVLLTCC